MTNAPETTPNAEQIAARLTEAQRELLLELSGAWKLVTIEEIKPLNKLGLTTGRKTSFGGYAARLLAPGQQAREILRRQA